MVWPGRLFPVERDPWVTKSAYRSLKVDGGLKAVVCLL